MLLNLWWALAPLPAILEGRRYRDAVRRSRALVGGHFWHALGTLLLGWFLIPWAGGWLVGAFVLVLVRLAGPDGLLLPVAGHVAWGGLATPPVVAVYVLLYRDLMARESKGHVR